MNKYMLSLIINVAFSSATMALADENQCTKVDMCSAVITAGYSEAEYISINSEVSQLLASVRDEIVGQDRNDQLIEKQLIRAVELCSLAKCKSNKTQCGQVFELKGLHLYLKEYYVPPLTNLDDLTFESPEYDYTVLY